MPRASLVLIDRKQIGPSASLSLAECVCITLLLSLYQAWFKNSQSTSDPRALIYAHLLRDLRQNAPMHFRCQPFRLPKFAREHLRFRSILMDTVLRHHRLQRKMRLWMIYLFLFVLHNVWLLRASRPLPIIPSWSVLFSKSFCGVSVEFLDVFEILDPRDTHE